MKPGNLAALFLFILPVIFIYCGIQTECSQIQWKHYHCGYSPRIHKMAVRDRYCIHLQSPVVSGLLSFCTVVPIKTDCYPNARFCPFISGCTGSTPGQGTKIPHATQWRVCVCVCVCIPWRRKWQPTLVVLPGESHRQRSRTAVHGGLRVRHNWSDLAQHIAYI